MKRLDIETVRKRFSERGYELLETDYRGVDVKMKYKCPHHPDKNTEMSFSKLKLGRGCPYCYGNVKYTIEEAKREFAARGYELIESKYKNSQTKMAYRCPKHPDKVSYMSLAKLKVGRGCPECKKNSIGDKLRMPFDEVEKAFSEAGYELLDKDYKNAGTNLRYRCPQHHDKELSMRYGNLRSGKRCPFCSSEKLRGEGSPNWGGGTTELNDFARKLLKNWKSDCLQKHNYKCLITKEGGYLHVHHPEPFHLIRDRILRGLNLEIKCNISDYTDEQLNVIRSEFLEAHTKLEGVPMKPNIHRLFHSEYGHKTSWDDLYEFKARWDAGEFEGKETKQPQQLSLLI